MHNNWLKVFEPASPIIYLHVILQPKAIRLEPLQPSISQLSKWLA